MPDVTLDELMNMVYTETNRPDLIAQTRQAILASTLKLHTMDKYYRDIRTAQVVFDFSAYIQQLDTEVFSRLRNFAYLRKWDPSLFNSQLQPINPTTNGVAGPVPVSVATATIELIDPSDFLDEYGYEKVDVGYVVGDSLMIRSSTAFQYLLVGWYQRPNISVDNYGTWLANTYPYAIVYDAAATIFTGMGQQDKSRTYSSPADPRRNFMGGLVEQQIALIRTNEIVAGGG